MGKRFFFLNFFLCFKKIAGSLLVSLPPKPDFCLSTINLQSPLCTKGLRIVG